MSTPDDGHPPEQDTDAHAAEQSGAEQPGAATPDAGEGFGLLDPRDGHVIGAGWPTAAAPDPEVVRRHESHLISQVYHLIEANQALEVQVHRLTKATEIADVLRGQGLTSDTFEMPEPEMTTTPRGDTAWVRVTELLNRLDDEDLASELREWLGVAREQGVGPDPAWLADVRTRLLAAEQTIAYLDEQTRELDALRSEKNSIMDGVSKLEQNIEDLWKALNEKTTHIQRLEKQLGRIWSSAPYKAFKAATRPFRRGS